VPNELGQKHFVGGTSGGGSVGGMCSIVFGDDCTPAPALVKVRSDPLDVQSKVPVTPVQSKSASYKSTVFSPVSENDKPVDHIFQHKSSVGPKGAHWKVDNVEIALSRDVAIKTAAKEIEPLHKKHGCEHAQKDHLATVLQTVDPNVRMPAPRSAKKTIATKDTIFSFIGENNKHRSVEDSRATAALHPSICPTVPSPAGHRIPVSCAAGVAPKQLETPVRVRGPVGGQVHIVFG